MKHLAESILFREAVPGDWSFIYETWLKGFRSSPACLGVLEARYFVGQRSRINRLAARPTFRVLVAVAPEDKAVIFAYLAHELRGNECVLHWAYTKSNFRKLGLARALLAQVNPKHLPLTHTHKMPGPMRINSSYNPYLLEDTAEAADIRPHLRS